MCLIINFIEDLHEYLTGDRCVNGNIIRKHSKKLEHLGDVSFPLNIKNWIQTIDKSKVSEKNVCIFDYLSPDKDLNSNLKCLIQKSKNWHLIIDNFKIKNENDVHLYLNRPQLICLSLQEVLKDKNTYGLKNKCFQNRISVIIDNSVKDDESEMTLTELRIIIIQRIASNILDHLTTENADKSSCNIRITFNSNEKQENVLVCGSVLNEAGVKDTKTTATDLYKKRSSDIQLMAQHKYGIRVKPLPFWTNYFEKLGKASVVIEMLQNKIHKPTKITLNSLQAANKGSSFIFYNCARLSALLKEFDDRVSNKTYPELPPVDKIDFSLLNQPEEWELVYVYIVQFPVVVKASVGDIQTGIINLHHLILFLSNLSSTFSVYYRRIKILTNAKDHLLPVLYTRIYLLKTIQYVFHTALHLLNIEPVKEM